MYNYEIIPYLQKVPNKLFKKDKQTYEQVLTKIEEIITCQNIEHYKNLKYILKDRKRIHVGSFVLVFKFIKEENKIVFMDFDHHDKVYLKK
jgi:mRNA-degrading endonuclease RelE of RelBE toxin-antitoxin system